MAVAVFVLMSALMWLSADFVGVHTQNVYAALQSSAATAFAPVQPFGKPGGGWPEQQGWGPGVQPSPGLPGMKDFSGSSDFLRQQDFGQQFLLNPSQLAQKRYNIYQQAVNAGHKVESTNNSHGGSLKIDGEEVLNYKWIRK